MRLLTVAGVTAGYGGSEHILKGLDFAVDEGEIVCIVGPNGAGKSTLLKTVAGLLRPQSGAITLREVPIGGRRPREVTGLGVAYVPQEHNVFTGLSVAENLEMGGFADTAGMRGRLDAVMQRFPVLGRKRRLAARALSGGERQLLAMGMALMVKPVLLLLDEPSAGLSPVAAQGLFREIRAIRDGGVAIALVEQNVTAALAVADRAYLFVDGRNRHDGPAAALAADPAIRRAFLGATH